jgi:thymidylate synthase
MADIELSLPRVSDIRSAFKLKWVNGEYVTDKTGARVIELIGYSFIADEDHIFGKPNPEYVARELQWYESQSLYVKDIPGTVPAIWEHVASKDGRINSNYGWCIWSSDNHDQFRHALNQLLAYRETRRSIMIYTRPSMQFEYNDNGMSDFVCTNAVVYFIRDGRLNAVVQMRSNDVVFGYRNDRAWQLNVLEKLVEAYNTEIDAYQPDHVESKITVGDLIWSPASLHVYERHFRMIDDAS